ncbi:cytochrome c [Nitrogeniibacter mangrovi]|uniref:Cytochrome c n=1 Tax=Nitrogeniibacter mangrovi TaxID=2016596 RepID=A0A6C1B4R2_9RHOO|nr:cytochrome c [Nitrogeniibacter mangrovi]QID18467.1 cytochrome c [Nitrogeniibacter mangrovi]
MNEPRTDPVIMLRFAALILALVAMTAHADMSIPTPSPGFKPRLIVGKTLYDKNCAKCHGADLTGTHQGPPMLNPIYRPGHHADPAFQMAVAHGAQAHHWPFGDMPPVPGLTPDDVGHITAYIRMRQRHAGIE